MVSEKEAQDPNILIQFEVIINLIVEKLSQRSCLNTWRRDEYRKKLSESECVHVEEITYEKNVK